MRKYGERERELALTITFIHCEPAQTPASQPQRCLLIGFQCDGIRRKSDLRDLAWRSCRVGRKEKGNNASLG